MPKSPEIVAYLDSLREKDRPLEIPATPMRAVIDTNVLMDFWHFRDPEVMPLLRLLESRAFIAIRDVETENEFAEVIGRPCFGVPLEEQKRILLLWHRIAYGFSRTRPAALGCKDPLDQKLFDLALSGEADLLITKDRLVQKAGRRTKKAGLLILGPAGAARLLQGDSIS